jgi:hypothetical protein
VGLGSIFGMSYMGHAMVQNAQMGARGTPIFAALGVALASIFFVFAALNGVVGYGLWNLRRWAFTVAIGLSSIGAVCSAVGVISGLVHFGIFRLLFWGICLGINLLILRYLKEPQVKQAFGAGTLPARGITSPTRA